MTIFRLFCLSFLFAGCATDGGMVVYWKHHQNHGELMRACGLRPTHGLSWGCAQVAVNVCIVHTRKDDKALNDTLGHELRHCFEREWH